MTSTAQISAQLYRSLAAHALGKYPNGVAASHKNLFKPNGVMWASYKELYLDQIDSFKNGNPAKRKPGDAVCQECQPFFLGNLKNIDKDSDIGLGKGLESCFLDFFNKELEARKSNLKCVPADMYDAQQPDYMHMPDFKVIDADGYAHFYLEFKAIFRPYIKISERVRTDYECYSHSQTLDISNGKKLENQKKLVEKIGVDKVAYVYWYDIPCVKGIFWLPASRVYELWDNGDTPRYERKTVQGDLNAQGYVRASIHKLYLPLLEMNDFDSLFVRCQTA